MPDLGAKYTKSSGRSEPGALWWRPGRVIYISQRTSRGGVASCKNVINRRRDSGGGVGKVSFESYDSESEEFWRTPTGNDAGPLFFSSF